MMERFVGLKASCLIVVVVFCVEFALSRHVPRSNRNWDVFGELKLQLIFIGYFHATFWRQWTMHYVCEFILVSEGRILSDLEQLEDLDRIVQETEG